MGAPPQLGAAPHRPPRDAQASQIRPLPAQSKPGEVRIAVLGASGYTGEEVVRLLSLHPNFKVTALTGDRQAGKVREDAAAPGGGLKVCGRRSARPPGTTSRPAQVPSR